MKFGCSSFTWDTEDGNHLLGRTYDQMGNLSNNRIALVPTGYRLRTTMAEGGESVTARYSMAGMAILGLPAPLFVDGVNERGLMGALLNYPGYAVYEEFPTEKRRPVHPGFLVGHLLGQAGTVKEAEKELKTIRLAPELVFGEHMSIHYMFSDRSGESIVVEPGEGGVFVHRDTIGVMTNSPDYLWHRTNLRNYRGAFCGAEERGFLNMRLEGFGEFSGGGFGLPGDYSSPSRFVRLALLKEMAVKGKTEMDGVTRMFQMFSAVDTPEGVLWKEETDGKRTYEMTLCTSIMCAESGTYYFSVRENRRICAVRLTDRDQGDEIQYFDLPKVQDIDWRNEKTSAGCF